MAQRIRDRGRTLALVAFTTLLTERLTHRTTTTDADDAMIGARNIEIGASRVTARRMLFEDVASTIPPQLMDKALVQELVRRRITNRRLPLGRAVGVREMPGDGQPCDACDVPITRGETLVLAIVSLEWKSVRFHIECYRAWDAERQTLFSDNGGAGSGR